MACGIGRGARSSLQTGEPEIPRSTACTKPAFHDVQEINRTGAHRGDDEREEVWDG